MKVLVAQSCLTLWNTMDCSPPSPSVRGILQARILEWNAISFSRGSSGSRDRTWVSCMAGSLSSESPGKPFLHILSYILFKMFLKSIQLKKYFKTLVQCLWLLSVINIPLEKNAPNLALYDSLNDANGSSTFDRDDGHTTV